MTATPLSDPVLDEKKVFEAMVAINYASTRAHPVHHVVTMAGVRKWAESVPMQCHIDAFNEAARQLEALRAGEKGKHKAALAAGGK